MDANAAAERIFAAIRAIPRGQIAGYGEVARRAGLPGRARLVARLLSLNSDRKLPWHRVLRSDGRVAFPQGSQAFDEQCQRLRSEGVTVEAGRVRGVRASATLDEQVWGAPSDMPTGGARGATPVGKRMATDKRSPRGGKPAAR